ncbi:MAG TPA: hypothetical protein VFB58_11475 [Chloroflexota bacterium]|nr:hypothetical protein [Chloroflexota bacterium]
MLSRLVMAAFVAAGVAVPLIRMHDQTGPVTFDDSSSDRLVIRAPSYQVALSKANGSLLSIAASGLVHYGHRQVVVAGPSAGQPVAGADHTGLVATRGDHDRLIHQP